MKSFTVSVNNVYGIPFITKEIAEYSQRVGASIIFGVTSLKDEIDYKGKEFILVVAGLPFLASARIPILGFKLLENGLYIKSTLPTKLKPNMIKVYGPNYKFPSSDELKRAYKTKSTEGIEAKRFVRYTNVPKDMMTSRMFNNTNKLLGN